MVDNLLLLEYTVDMLNKLSFKYEIHRFSSGAIMLDIWCKDKFYVLQFEDDFVGFSDIDDNVGFDTEPDERFNDEMKFKEKLELVLNNEL